jgi:hypothetical protein
MKEIFQIIDRYPYCKSSKKILENVMYKRLNSFIGKKVCCPFHFILFSINILQVDKLGCGNGQYEYRVRIYQLYVQKCMNLSLKSITTIN